MLLAEFIICIVLAITAGNIIALSVRGMMAVYTFVVLVILLVYPPLLLRSLVFDSQTI